MPRFHCPPFRSKPTLREGEGVLVQQVAGAFRVIDHQTQDGTVRRVEHGEREDMHLARGEQLHDLVQAPDAVRGEHGKLDDGIAAMT